jgi:rod shape-determining protein MreD
MSMRRTIAYILLSIVLLVFSTTLLKFLAIDDIVPDVLLIWIVYLAIKEGQFAGMVAGFLIGLTFDLLSGPDGMLGLSALTKTLAGFLAGYFFDENKTFQTLGGYQFLLAVGLITLVHHAIYFLIFLQGTDIGWGRTLLFYSIPDTFYTTAVSLLPMFAIARKYLS